MSLDPNTTQVIVPDGRCLSGRGRVHPQGGILYMRLNSSFFPQPSLPDGFLLVVGTWQSSPCSARQGSPLATKNVFLNAKSRGGKKVHKSNFLLTKSLHPAQPWGSTDPGYPGRGNRWGTRDTLVNVMIFKTLSISLVVASSSPALPGLAGPLLQAGQASHASHTAPLLCDSHLPRPQALH